MLMGKANTLTLPVPSVGDGGGLQKKMQCVFMNGWKGKSGTVCMNGSVESVAAHVL